MPRCPAQRRRVRALPVLAVLLLPWSACGAQEHGPSSAGASTGSPAPAVVECRERWTELGEQLEETETRTEPSALASRWTSVVATIDYYASVAGPKDCAERLDAQEKAVAALRAFSESLRGWDMEYALEQVAARASEYANGPRPPAPTPTAASSKGKKGKQARVERPPKPADVATALSTLNALTTVATREQGPAWRQAEVVDLADAAAVAKARKDLAFLSGESKAFRQCQAALALIGKGLAATG